MFNLKTRLKKWIALGVAAVGINFVATLPARADSSEYLLGLIAQFTHDTAVAAYSAEQYIYAILTFLNGWILPDQSEVSANLQSGFATLTNGILQNADTQNTVQAQLTQEFLQGANIPEINDLAYESLLGQLLVPNDPRGKDVNPAYNYIKNAAGLNIQHITPNPGWEGNDGDKENYKRFYSTISAVQTYSGYILSKVYADYANGTHLTQQQNALMQQASSSDWFTQVASENIGIVLRQILMYNSQTYALLIQLVQTQQQALAAQAMANTLIVLGNQFNETQLLSKARKRQP